MIPFLEASVFLPLRLPTTPVTPFSPLFSSQNGRQMLMFILSLSPSSSSSSALMDSLNTAVKIRRDGNYVLLCNVTCTLSAHKVSCLVCSEMDTLQLPHFNKVSSFILNSCIPLHTSPTTHFSTVVNLCLNYNDHCKSCVWAEELLELQWEKGAIMFREIGPFIL